MNFRLIERKVEGISVIRLIGEVNKDAVPTIQTQVDELLASDQSKIIIDVSKAIYVDTDGLGLLRDIYEKCVESGGNMTVVCTNNPRVHQILEITRLKEKFGVHENIKSARVVLETIK